MSRAARCALAWVVFSIVASTTFAFVLAWLLEARIL